MTKTLSVRESWPYLVFATAAQRNLCAQTLTHPLRLLKCMAMLEAHCALLEPCLFKISTGIGTL